MVLGPPQQIVARHLSGASAAHTCPQSVQVARVGWSPAPAEIEEITCTWAGRRSRQCWVTPVA
ncbi:MAG TPA: hypothetical protein VFI47_26340 [Acidimicrobiales bacterium]|nr:hypothetical protein [Acidimicrobiales bacterium]